MTAAVYRALRVNLRYFIPHIEDLFCSIESEKFDHEIVLGDFNVDQRKDEIIGSLKRLPIMASYKL